MKNEPKLEWLKMSPGQWIFGRISKKSKEVQGFFINLCFLSWCNDGELSNDVKSLSFDLHETPNKTKKILEILLSEGFLIEEENKLIIKFVKEQYLNTKQDIKERSEKAREKAGKRWSRALPDQCSSNAADMLEQYNGNTTAMPEQCNSNATAMPEQCNGNAVGMQDKRREEKNKKTRQKKKVFFDETFFPENLRTPEFMAAWAVWAQHRLELRKGLTATGARMQINSLARLGVGEAVLCINNSVRNGYIGLFPENFQVPKTDMSDFSPKEAETPECVREELADAYSKPKIVLIQGASNE